MELLAFIQALKIIDDKINRNEINPKIIVIYTDSTYVINCITKWYSNWIKNNWKNSKNDDVENKDLIQLLYELKSKYITIFKHIRSHQSEPTDKDSEKYCHWYGNYMADKLASNASKQYMNEKLNENEILEEVVKSKSKLKSKKIQNSLNI
jgi:ribonuclease HI